MLQRHFEIEPTIPSDSVSAEPTDDRPTFKKHLERFGLAMEYEVSSS